MSVRAHHRDGTASYPHAHGVQGAGHCLVPVKGGIVQRALGVRRLLDVAWGGTRSSRAREAPSGAWAHVFKYIQDTQFLLERINYNLAQARCSFFNMAAPMPPTPY